ncbi:bifunctional folylpolyglutamate synthase/dihydrofolate synthase [Bacteroidota bacterium]
MNYKETIQFLFSSLPMYQRDGKAAYKSNLNNTYVLDKALNHPHTKFKSIHIAGTNGKGSVSHMLASVFQAAGYKTGLYTSPHLLDFRERIRINGEKITEQAVVDFVERIEPVIRKIHPSFFEMTVAMAFDYFANEEVDIALIETGMGGRLDSTNIIQPVISVITSISMDHSEFLGNTLSRIAEEKCGIIKHNTPLISVSDPPEVKESILQAAESKKAKVFWANELWAFTYQMQSMNNTSLFHYHKVLMNAEEVFESDLTGSYQAENLSIALTTFDLLSENGWKIEKVHISEGLASVKKRTSLLGRWDILGANPRIICDTAHNSEGIQAVFNQLKEIPAKRLHVIWGMVSEKNPETILPLLPKNALYYFTQPSVPRRMPVEKLEAVAHDAGLKGNTFTDVKAAYDAAIAAAEPEDTVFIGGSTFVAADLYAFLKPDIPR